MLSRTRAMSAAGFQRLWLRVNGARLCRVWSPNRMNKASAEGIQAMSTATGNTYMNDYFLGVDNAPFVNKMEFTSPRLSIPIYRVLDDNGKLLDEQHIVEVGISRIRPL